MATTTFSIQELQENVRAVAEAAQSGPVFIADSDGPRAVLLSFHDFRTLQRKAASLAEAFSVGGLSEEGANFEFPKLELVLNPADLT